MNWTLVIGALLASTWSLSGAVIAGAPCGAPDCTADLSGDGEVGVADMVDVILNWGPCPEPCPPTCFGDVTGDCMVSVGDLVELITNWGPCPAPTPIIIEPGFDCFITPCGDSQLSFASAPIPADFFLPGSEPFDGVIQLGRSTRQVDTIFQRFDLIALPAPGAGGITAIEIIDLDLVSCQPISVVVDGLPQQWDVQVSLATSPPSVGQMQIQRTHGEGGVFSAEFTIHPLFTFIRQSDQLQIGPTGFEGFEDGFLLQNQFATWLSVEVPGDCSPGDCFAPGWNSLSGLLCCEPSCHNTIPPGDKLLCTEPPRCPACPGPCGPDSGSCFKVNGTPGCEDPSCCDLVCEVDPFCCDVSWDGVCVDDAEEFCVPAHPSE